MPYRRAQQALTTWVSQNLVLSAALVWGLSYLADPRYRVKFSEVFPPTLAQLTPMWIWGLLLAVASAVSLISDGVLKLHHGRPLWAYKSALAGHWVLSCTYVSLVFIAIVDGMKEVPWHLFGHEPWHWWSAFISACSRPVLWWVITYLHSAYARLPVPTEHDLELMDEEDEPSGVPEGDPGAA